MHDSDRRYLSRFALDPTMESGWEELNELDFLCRDMETDSFDEENISDADDLMPEDDFLS